LSYHLVVGLIIFYINDCCNVDVPFLDELQVDRIPNPPLFSACYSRGHGTTTPKTMGIIVILLFSSNVDCPIGSDKSLGFTFLVGGNGAIRLSV
jgi:hypothetical protein